MRGPPLSAILPFVALTAPLFVLIALGFAIARSGRWPATSTDALTRFVFAIAVPALLFRLMSDFSKLPPIDPRVLVAYFGACLAVFAAGRLASRALFRHDGVTQSVFALGGVFSNTVLLGLPLVQVTLGAPAMPAVSLIVVFNALILWTLVSVSVEWARHGSLGWRQFALTVRNVLLNPVVASILVGTAFGYSGLALPGFAERALALLAQAAVPLSLVALGLGLGEVALGAGWRESVAIAGLKLAALPTVAWALGARRRPAARRDDRGGRDGRAADRRERLPDGAPFPRAGRPGRREHGRDDRARRDHDAACTRAPRRARALGVPRRGTRRRAAPW